MMFVQNYSRLNYDWERLKENCIKAYKTGNRRRPFHFIVPLMAELQPSEQNDSAAPTYGVYIYLELMRTIKIFELLASGLVCIIVLVALVSISLHYNLTFYYLKL
jgi:hypothetical protein